MRTNGIDGRTRFGMGFRSGLASIACPLQNGTTYRNAIMEREAKGTAGDWQAIGNDMRAAIVKYKKTAPWRDK